MTRRVIVGFSGGVTSTWCAGWALRNYPRDDVRLLWHDTKEEHPDTYRFLREAAAKLGMEITERSDGRSVTELFEDEEFLGNNQNTMCSRVLKAAQSDRYLDELRIIHGPTLEVIKVIGYSAAEPQRVSRMVGRCATSGITPRFPIIEEGLTKQEIADWCSCVLGVRPSAMYEWSDHANCLGCVKGGRAYWLAINEHHPEVAAQRVALEDKYGHTIIRGENPITLRELFQIGKTKRKVNRREAITIGACDCGD